MRITPVGMGIYTNSKTNMQTQQTLSDYYQNTKKDTDINFGQSVPVASKTKLGAFLLSLGMLFNTAANRVAASTSNDVDKFVNKTTNVIAHKKFALSDSLPGKFLAKSEIYNDDFEFNTNNKIKLNLNQQQRAYIGEDVCGYIEKLPKGVLDIKLIEEFVPEIDKKYEMIVFSLPIKEGVTTNGVVLKNDEVQPWTSGAVKSELCRLREVFEIYYMPSAARFLGYVTMPPKFETETEKFFEYLAKNNLL